MHRPTVSNVSGFSYGIVPFSVVAPTAPLERVDRLSTARRRSAPGVLRAV